MYTAGPLDDLDWDLVRYQYTWSVGGRVVRDVISAGLADHLPRLEACAGSVVKCVVTSNDGSIDGQASTTTIRIAGESNGDVDCDGSVEVSDLLILIGNWGSCSVCSGDLNDDGEVNVSDILILIANWG